MSKRLPSTKYTSPPHKPGLFIEDEESDVPATRFVPSSRKLVAGVGLEGGGDLAKDRKFDIKFGDEEGTAVEGNDPRLSDAREWSADQATTEELEAGTEEEPRKVSPKDLHTATEAWWESSDAAEKLSNIPDGATKNESDDYLLNRKNHTGTQSIDTVENLRGILDSLGSSGSSSGNLFSIVKTVELIDADEYVLTSADIGRTLIMNSVSDKLNIQMNACFGSLSDEIYIVAPRAFLHDSSNPINFFTQINFVEQGGGIVKVPPVFASGLVPSFRDGRAIVCLKKCFTGGVGMDDWLLFGDLASGESLA